MNSDDASPNVSALAPRWWMLVVRGVVAILFGIRVAFVPATNPLPLVLGWGAYALADGMLTLMLAARRDRPGRSLSWLRFGGVVGVVTGAFALARSDMRAATLLTMIAVWAFVTGSAEIAAAIRLRRVIRGEWLLASAGILSLILGALLLAFPGSEPLSRTWLIAIYAFVFGTLLVGLGLIQPLERSSSRTLPTRRTSNPA
jgi:uncharacterized membrane protein HdeD (DUF308 family)